MQYGAKEVKRMFKPFKKNEKCVDKSKKKNNNNYYLSLNSHRTGKKASISSLSQKATLKSASKLKIFGTYCGIKLADLE